MCMQPLLFIAPAGESGECICISCQEEYILHLDRYFLENQQSQLSMEITASFKVYLTKEPVHMVFVSLHF